MSLEVSQRTIGSCIVVELHGELDVETAPAVRTRFDALVDGPLRVRVVVDLSGLQFMASIGLRVLLEAERRARVGGGTLALAAPRPVVARVLQLTALDEHFAVYATVVDAVAACGRGDPGEPGVCRPGPEPVH